MSDTDNPKHVKITNYALNDDGSILAVTETYFEKLASLKQEVVKSIKTNHNDFLKDLISSVDVISKQQTKELELRISVDEWGKPCRIVKQYTIQREDYKRR